MTLKIRPPLLLVPIYHFDNTNNYECENIWSLLSTRLAQETRRKKRGCFQEQIPIQNCRISTEDERLKMKKKEMSCDCRCQLELEKLSEENKSIQKALVDIKLMVEKFTAERKQYWKEEAVRRREKAW